MESQLILGLVSMLGALVFNLWGFIQALDDTKKTERVEKFNIVRTLITVLPTLVVGFLAGFQMDPNTPVEFVSIAMAGFGLAAAQWKAKITNRVEAFFDVE
jgi:O-antigen ligase